MISKLILALAAVATAAAVEDAPDPSPKLRGAVSPAAAIEAKLQPRRKANGWTLFHLDKQPFVQVFADCLKDPGCSIQYLHRGKTGGTFVESQMFTMLGTKNEASCCQQRVVERFLKNRHYKCTLPFIAYQVKTAAFRDVILKECQKVFARTAQSSGARQRMVVLVTYREPVAKTISYVHQVCNKNLRGRSRSVQNICRRCNYHADPDHYRSMVGLPHVYKHMLANRTYWSSLMEGDYPIADGLAIDNADLNSFFGELMKVVPPEFVQRLENRSGVANVEKKGICDFKVPSVMLKDMSEALLVYRNISIGEL